MIRKIFFIICLFFTLSTAYSQSNKFFIDLSNKDIATFNDAITLMRLLFNERDDNSVFIDNVIWAASKKLFKVTIPIKDNQINPIITRKELAYWLCAIYILDGNKRQIGRLSRLYSYKVCTGLGILDVGRGPDDGFSGKELIDNFSYIDYYVRSKNISVNEEVFDIIKDEYDIYPNWRKVIYKELDEQQRKEKELKKQQRLQRKKDRAEKNKVIKQEENEVEKIIE